MTLWSGRFRAGLNSLASELNNSLPVDKRLYAEDIRGSQAWARALAAAGVITVQEAETLVNGLDTSKLRWMPVFPVSQKAMKTSIPRSSAA